MDFYYDKVKCRMIEQMLPKDVLYVFYCSYELLLKELLMAFVSEFLQAEKGSNWRGIRGGFFS